MESLRYPVTDPLDPMVSWRSPLMSSYQEESARGFNDIDPLAEASEQDSLLGNDDEYNQLLWKQVEDEFRGMDEVTNNTYWESPSEEAITAAYADAYEQQAFAESVRLWIAEHPVEAVKMLATHLDGMANNYQQSQAGRYARIAATEAHKLHWLLIGSDEAISELNNEMPAW